MRAERPGNLPAGRLSGFGVGLRRGLGSMLLAASLATASGAAEPSTLQTTVPVLTVAAVSAAPGPAARAIDPLLAIPGLTPFRSDAQRTDESLAAAVELGNNPDLEPVSKFRKRSTDLFRTEREVEIGQREMLLRLRLRAKTRRAVSVELRF
jgi:hypothetical protein